MHFTRVNDFPPTQGLYAIGHPYPQGVSVDQVLAGTYTVTVNSLDCGEKGLRALALMQKDLPGDSYREWYFDSNGGLTPDFSTNSTSRLAGDLPKGVYNVVWLDWLNPYYECWWDISLTPK